MWWNDVLKKFIENCFKERMKWPYDGMFLSIMVLDLFLIIYDKYIKSKIYIKFAQLVQGLDKLLKNDDLKYKF